MQFDGGIDQEMHEINGISQGCCDQIRYRAELCRALLKQVRVDSVLRKRSLNSRIISEQQSGHNLRPPSNVHLSDAEWLDCSVSQFDARAKRLAFAAINRCYQKSCVWNCSRGRHGPCLLQTCPSCLAERKKLTRHIERRVSVSDFLSVEIADYIPPAQRPKSASVIGSDTARELEASDESLIDRSDLEYLLG